MVHAAACQSERSTAEILVHQRSSSGEPPAGTDEVLSRLIMQTARGEHAAFEELYRLTSAHLFGACLRIIPNRGDAEEALQDTFVTIWRSAGAFDEARGRAMTWLLTLSRNRAIDRLRATRGRAGLETPYQIDIADDAPSPLAVLGADEETRRLAFCLDQLASGDLRLIRASFFEGSSYSQLADRVAMPLGSVKSRIRRALLKLRTCLA